MSTDFFKEAGQKLDAMMAMLTEKTEAAPGYRERLENGDCEE